MTKVRITGYMLNRDVAIVEFQFMVSGVSSSCLIQWDGDTLTREMIQESIARTLHRLKGTAPALDLLKGLVGEELDIDERGP